MGKEEVGCVSPPAPSRELTEGFPHLHGPVSHSPGEAEASPFLSDAHLGNKVVPHEGSTPQPQTPTVHTKKQKSQCSFLGAQGEGPGCGGDPAQRK